MQQPVTASPGRVVRIARQASGGVSAIVERHDSSRSVATSVSEGRCVDCPRQTIAFGVRNEIVASSPRNTSSFGPLPSGRVSSAF